MYDVEALPVYETCCLACLKAVIRELAPAVQKGGSGYADLVIVVFPGFVSVSVIRAGDLGTCCPSSR